MKELTGRITDMSLNFATGKPKLQIEINEKQTAFAMFEELKDCEKVTLKVGKFRQKRSLDANAYFFVLADKLAAKLNTTKEAVYRHAIKEIGGVSEIVCVKDEAVETLCQKWSCNGLGWQTDTFPSKIEGCTNVILYYGSSTYNVSQMQRLIQNITDDCVAMGIDVRTPEEIASMLDLWGQKEVVQSGEKQ